LNRVTKAVIPAAGLGTRLAPLTRHLPKELLPVGGKPMIRHTLEAYMASGIRRLAVIISPSKDLLRAYLSENRLPSGLPFRKDTDFRRRLKSCEISFFVQEQPSGVAEAVSLTRGFVGSDPFACIMPDCLLFAGPPFPQQLVKAYERCGTNVIGTILLRGKDLGRFGNVGLLETHPVDDRLARITSLSPKRPTPLSASHPGTYHKGFGGGVYLPEYFKLADRADRDDSGELDDVPIHHAMIAENRLHGIRLEGEPFDAGHPLGLRAATHFQGRRLRTRDRGCLSSEEAYAHP
jgi:UTP--glucose-1-phosphate uridylyltransferase